MVQTQPFSNWQRISPDGRRWHFILPIMVVTLVMLLLAPDARSINLHPNYVDGGGSLYKPAVAPNKALRVHRVGNVWFSLTNYGKLGSEGRDIYDPLTNESAPSCEFPAGSNLEYLFGGCLWIGAIVEGDEIGELDTLVSIGDDGWWHDIQELNPAPPPNGDFMMLSTRGVSAPPYAPTTGSLAEISNKTFEAISEQDFICVMTDTIIVGVTPDPNDSRPHRPLNMKILQKSYSWSYEYAEDFVLIDFEIENIGLQDLKNVWIGIYIDADVAHTSEDGYGSEEGAQDDICGFLEYYYPNPEDTTIRTDIRTEIFTAWIADNDAQPDGGAYVYTSARGLSGCRVVQAPSTGSSPESDDIEYGFNWWISNQSDPQLDWSPQWVSNFAKWGIFPGGGRGTPGGDRAKYQVMSNHEFDYDQIWCNLDIWPNQDTAWVPKSQQADDLADGYDTRYLFSFGEFESILPGEVLPLTVAYICGEKLHNDLDNYPENLQGSNNEDSSKVALYYDGLNFRDFATNAQWAEWVYDNPGRDSCFNPETEMWELDGDFGEADTTGLDPEGNPILFWYKGDGCPDFKGPPPPNSPRLDFEVDKGVVKLVWQSINTGLGEENTGSEDAIDSFNGKLV